MRVYELAKELKISPTEMKERLSSFEVDVKSNFQQVDESIVRKLREGIEEEEPALQISEEDAQGRVRRKPSLKLLEIPAGITVKEFAEAVNMSPTDLIKRLIKSGEMVTINQQLSLEAATLVGEEFGYEVIAETPPEEQMLEAQGPEGPQETRPPVVTVMGHVDHGKTSLLDAIRQTDVIAGEAGGITQHIGAYQINHNDHKITFIDTPGHEAFTAMRARGAKVTDIAILVVAADDGVKAQTLEALDHAKAAGVPIIVAVNKIDKEGANPDKVKQQLSEQGLIPEAWGGDTIYVELSAKQRTNIDGLLEMIVLVTEVEELTAPREGKARGVVIESQLERGRGSVATVLIQSGTLKVGDIIVAGNSIGRVRALVDEHGKHHPKAYPSQPVEVLGLGSPPGAGDDFVIVSDEKKARAIVEERVRRSEALRRGAAPTVYGLLERIRQGELEELRIILKADVQGSLEALREAIEKEQREDVRVTVIHQGVGAISETDVMLAAASQALLIGFNVRPEPKAIEMASKEKVEVRLHRVIYQVVDDIKSASVGLLKPQIDEVDMGRVEVRDVFKVPKIGLVAGCYVLEGEVTRDSLVRIVRDGVLILDGKIGSLRRFKEDVASVKSGFECGISIDSFQDVKNGDVFEIYKKVEKARE